VSFIERYQSRVFHLLLQFSYRQYIHRRPASTREARTRVKILKLRSFYYLFPLLESMMIHNRINVLVLPSFDLTLQPPSLRDQPRPRESQLIPYPH
jgi:hypothetical protein